MTDPSKQSLSQLANTLPWGFHDAHLERLAVDWLASTLTLELRLPMSRDQSVERVGRVHVTGLFFLSIEPPALGDDDYPRIPREGLWLDGAEGPAPGAVNLPPLPDGVWLHHFWIRPWQHRTLHVAGRDCRLEWLGPEQPRRNGAGALFPGDEVKGL